MKNMIYANWIMVESLRDNKAKEKKREKLCAPLVYGKAEMFVGDHGQILILIFWFGVWEMGKGTDFDGGFVSETRSWFTQEGATSLSITNLALVYFFFSFLLLASFGDNVFCGFIWVSLILAVLGGGWTGTCFLPTKLGFFLGGNRWGDVLAEAAMCTSTPSALS